jgi:hypothetical protein
MGHFYTHALAVGQDDRGKKNRVIGGSRVIGDPKTRNLDSGGDQGKWENR